MGTAEAYGARERAVGMDEAAQHRVSAGAIEAFAGLSTIVLAILGLADIVRPYMLPIATLVLGAALLFESGAVVARWSLLARSKDRGSGWPEIGGMTTAEMLGGATGIVLGILGLLGIATMTLSAAAVVVFGAVLMLGSGPASRLNALASAGRAAGEHLEIAREVVSATASSQLMIGLAAIVLGILALVGVSAPVLTLVALLVLGLSTLMTGSAASTAMYN